MRTLRAILLGLLALAVIACQSQPITIGRQPESRLQGILESNQLRVGLSGNQPPLNMRNSNGEIIGLEVDLVNALAHSMGLEVMIIERPFADLLPALEKDEVDMVISGVTITPERNSHVAFAGPYFISGKSLLTRNPAIANVATPTALDEEGRRYAALAGSTSAEFVEDVLPRSTLIPTRDYDTAVKMVMEDQVDALIADYPICVISVMRHPEAGLSTLVTPFTIEPLGIALPADDPLLVNLVANYLNTLEATGLLTQLKAKWFSRGNWAQELP